MGMKSLLAKSLMCVIAAASISGYAGDAADNSRSNALEDTLVAKMTGNPGLTLASPIAGLSYTSNIMAIEPPWRTRRFYSMEDGRPGPREEVEGGYKVSMLQGNGTHEFKLNEYSCVVTGDTALVTLDCEATADIPSVFEYSAFAVPYSLLVGAEYEGKLEDGTEIKGKISEKEPAPNSPWLMYEKVREIEFKTALGELSVELKEGPAFNIGDRRTLTFADKKGFWFGYQTTLDYGKPFRSVIEIQFDINDDLKIAVPETDGTDTPLAVEVDPAGVTTYAPDMPLLPVPKKMVQPMPGEGGFFVPAEKISFSIAGLDGNDTEIDRLARAVARVWAKMGVDAELASADNAALKIEITEQAPVENEEGYYLDVKPDSISVISKTPRGAFYAMQTLRGIFRDGKIAEIKIEDWPDMSFRAAMFLVDDYSHIFHTRMVDDVLAPLKYNTIVPEVEYVKWDATSDVHQPWGMSKEDYINLVKWCQDNYIDVVPLFQTFGHCGWMFPKDENGNFKNLDLAEDVNYPYAYNVSNPRLYPYIEKALDEVIEASGYPKYLHIGHDEVFHPKAEFPARPENKKLGIQKILYDDIMWYYNYANKHNMKIMMWHDLLVTPEESTENGAGGAPHNLAEVRKKLPKDITMAAWRYDGRPVDFPDITALRNEGFPLIGASWYEDNNIENLTKFCLKQGGFGLLQTIWCGYNGNKIVTHNGFWQLTPYVRTGVWTWNANDAVNKYDPARVLCDMVCNWQDNPTAGDVKLIDMTPVANLKISEENNPFLSGDTYGMDTIPTGTVNTGLVKFKIAEKDGAPLVAAVKSRLNPMFPETVKMPLNLKCNELYVLAAVVDVAPAKFATIANMTIEYEDGTTIQEPLKYTWQLSAIDDEFNYHLSTGNSLEWEGNGKLYHSWFFTWKNPQPDKIVKSISFASTEAMDSLYLLGISAK